MPPKRASKPAADANGRRLVILAAAGAAFLLVRAGLIDAARAGEGLFAWKLDEALFFLLVLLVAVLGVTRAAHRRTAREIERHREEERTARALALRDPLTGLLNRRGLEEAARVAPSTAGRLLLLADLDRFKAVNDTHGHSVGDEALRRFGERLRVLAEAGVAIGPARLGGDEFVLALSAADEDDSAVRARVAAPIEFAAPSGEHLLIDVSVGAVRWTPDSTLESALERADQAMYESKARGSGTFDGGRTLPAHPLNRAFEQRIATSPNRHASLCVAAIGIDRYQSTKRTLGYDFAARLLRAVRDRLEEHRPALLIERLGSDTLGVLFPADDVGEALRVIDALNALSAPSYLLDDRSVDLPLTIGVAGPAPAAALRETVEQAQFALDEARRTGRRQVVFDLRERHRIAQNVRLMSELRTAIAADELELHYQPKLSARTGEIDSFEALVRWPHRERGSVSPAEFVPLAEESGDVEALTWWVLERAARDWRRLADRRLARPIYVNVSAQLVGDDAFAERLVAMLGAQDGRIGVEITETAMLADPDRALLHLRRLAEAGVSIAIDDYGVGLSSLSYLKQLPATELKIDMMFITDLAESHRDPMIVRSTIDLAHGLGLRVTAEGVDKPEALALLKIMGCDLIQGHQIAAAMPLPELARFMEEHDADAEHVPECAAQLLAFTRAGSADGRLDGSERRPAASRAA